MRRRNFTISGPVVYKRESCFTVDFHACNYKLHMLSRCKFLPKKHSRNLLKGVASLVHTFDGCEEEQERVPSQEWYRKAYPKLIKLAHGLKNFQQVDGRTINKEDGSTVTDDRVLSQVQTFRSIAMAFVGSPTMQRSLPTTSVFSKHRQRKTMVLNSLTSVCNFLNVSAQQRKSIRLTLCRQITQQQIFRETVLELLDSIGTEIGCYLKRNHGNNPNPSSMHMAEQIVSICSKFLVETTGHSDKDSSPQWMQLSSSFATRKLLEDKKTNKLTPLNVGTKDVRRWEEVLEMFEDLTEWLEKEKMLFADHLNKIEAVKEGLYHIKDIFVEREIGYREARRQDCLVQKKLSSNLGHSSKCLFTLLLYYLYGTVRDVEVDACGLYQSTKSKEGVLLCVGKVLTSVDESTVLAGMKQLDRAIGLFRFVWETANMKGGLDVEGHLWCVGAKERNLTYRGTMFWVHDFRL